MRRFGVFFLVMLGFAAIWSYASWKGDGSSETPIRFIVAEGSSTRATAHALAQAGIIKSPTAFMLLARIFGGGGAIKSGLYRIKAHESAADVLAQLQAGKTMQQLITIPEGMPAVMVYDRLMATKGLVGTIAIPAEGRVLPESYSFDDGEPRATVLARMTSAMKDTLAKEWAARSAEAVVKTPTQALILASIVEKETALASERPLVAGVYSSRLKLSMRLQADPTVIYPLTKGRPLGRRILRSELETDNGYNTYLKAGLTSGPIANPGRASIHAVLHPAATSALYFVANGQGGHIFSATLAEQNVNVKKYYALRHARGEM